MAEKRSTGPQLDSKDRSAVSKRDLVDVFSRLAPTTPPHKKGRENCDPTREELGRCYRLASKG